MGSLLENSVFMGVVIGLTLFVIFFGAYIFICAAVCCEMDAGWWKHVKGFLKRVFEANVVHPMKARENSTLSTTSYNASPKLETLTVPRHVKPQKSGTGYVNSTTSQLESSRPSVVPCDGSEQPKNKTPPFKQSQESDILSRSYPEEALRSEESGVNSTASPWPPSIPRNDVKRTKTNKLSTIDEIDQLNDGELTS